MKELLKSPRGRQLAIRDIEFSFIRELWRIPNITLSQDAVCKITSTSIKLGIEATGAAKKSGFVMEFASEIEIRAQRQSNYFPSDNEINFGSSGAFTPKNRSEYWRTIHAAEILRNWDAVMGIVNDHCRRYEELEKEIFAINQQA